MITQEGAQNANVPIFRLFDPSGVRLISLYRQNLSGDQVWIQHSGSYNFTSGTLPLNTWGFFEMHITVAGTGASTIRVFLNGTQIYQTTTASLGNTGVLSIQAGNDTSRQTFTLHADDIYVTR